MANIRIASMNESKVRNKGKNQGFHTSQKTSEDSKFLDRHLYVLPFFDRKLIFCLDCTFYPLTISVLTFHTCFRKAK